MQPVHRRDSENTELRTRRLLLQRPRRLDVKRIVELAGPWSVAGRLGVLPYPLEQDDVRQWLAQGKAEWGRDSFHFGLYPREQNASIAGVISIFSLISAAPAIGFWLGEPYWGRGLMSEAVAAMASFAFSRLGAPSLGADFFLDNPASGRVLQKNGFVETSQSLMWSRPRMSYQQGCSMLLTRECWATFPSSQCSDS